MIVRPGEGTLHLITQPDHAALARRIMDQCVPLREAARQASILHAIAEHDNGWHGPDRAPSVDPATGEIFDFVRIPIAVRQAVWPRGVARLSQTDRWAAALVAQHALTVYDRHRADEAWSGFFAEMEAMRAALVEASGFSLKHLAQDYPYLRLADLASLTFCSRSGDEQTYDRWTCRLEGTRLLITPNLFGGGELSIDVMARELPDASFQSDSHLREACGSAPVVTLRGLVAGA